MSQPAALLSIVVPTRNRAALLRKCLQSLLLQDFPSDRYEVVVIDDNSTDETSRVAEQVQASQPAVAVRCVRSPGRGLNLARNLGIEAARGDPIIFVDDDVDAPVGWLRSLMEGVLRHPEAGCLGGPIRLRLEAKPPRLCGREGLGETELDLGPVEKPVPAVWGANFCIRRSALGLVGSFNEALSGYGDETEWELRLLAAGGCIVYLPDAWLWHRRTAENLRLDRLLRSRFQRGVSDVRFLQCFASEARPWEVRPWTELVGLLRGIAHGVRRRCTWGFLSASVHGGRLWGLVLGRRGYG